MPIALAPTVALAALLLPTPPAQDAADDAALRAELAEELGFELPPTARADVVATLLEDARTPRHPADGGGGAAFEGEPAPARVGRPGRWTIRYTAGERGVAVGGAVYLQASPFWGWSTPQTESEEAAGFTRVATEAEGVTLAPTTVAQGLLAVAVGGRALGPGESIVIDYGAGPAGARPDRYAESRSPFTLAVDGDGDGVRELIDRDLVVPVAAGPAARLVLTLPATARVGDTVRLTVAVLDAAGNAGPDFEGEVALVGLPEGAVESERLAFAPGDGARRALSFAVTEPGTLRLAALALGADDRPIAEAFSNPLRVSSGPRVLFGDLQGHSGLTDGTGTAADYYAYARDVAGLDFVALTDHDRWGLRPLDSNPDVFATIPAAAAAAERPGVFLPLVGVEWTSWIFGHRHAVWFGGEPRVLSSFDRATDTPEELWAALEGEPVLVVPHHPAGGPIAIDWSRPPHPVLEPLVEICSVHGASDRPGDPIGIRQPVESGFVRPMLRETGYRYGFCGGGDTHDGHPGLGQLGARTGGLTGVLAEELTPEALLEALRARRCFATSGARIVLRANLAGAKIGAAVPAAEVAEGARMLLEVIGEGPLARVELVGREGVLAALDAGGAMELRDVVDLDPLAPGDWVFLRVDQEDGHAAWSSPWRVE